MHPQLGLGKVPAALSQTTALTLPQHGTAAPFSRIATAVAR